ncbi:MAG: metal-dependent hydrolase [Methanobacterium sp.]|nr:metal-dependent hydrolase [Methanobacterium sp.]
MPDWITHIAVAYTLCALLGLKYKQFNTPNTVLVMIGAVIPDLVKVGMIFDYLGSGVWEYIWPLHLPIGSLIITTIMALLFKEKKSAFLFLLLGMVTHFGLDLLLENVGGGIILFYPFYWGGWQLNLVATDDYHITIISLVLALLAYLVSRRWGKNKQLNDLST